MSNQLTKHQTDNIYSENDGDKQIAFNEFDFPSKSYVGLSESQVASTMHIMHDSCVLHRVYPRVIVDD